MNTLFDTSQNQEITTNGISGLSYIPNFINKAEQNLLINSIDEEEWLNDLKRRVQHYGYKYDYKKRSIDESLKIQDIPNWAMELTNKMQKQSIIEFTPDQMIVNEYYPGQGIADHIDCEPCFQGTILSLSLGSPVNMNFKEKTNPKNKVSILLEPGSLVVLRGDARYHWTHGIATTKNYRDNNGKLHPRTRRVSLTYRKVILKSSNNCKVILPKKQNLKEWNDSVLDDLLIDIQNSLNQKDSVSALNLICTYLSNLFDQFKKINNIDLQEKRLIGKSKEISQWLANNSNIPLKTTNWISYLVFSIVEAKNTKDTQNQTFLDTIELFSFQLSLINNYLKKISS